MAFVFPSPTTSDITVVVPGPPSSIALHLHKAILSNCEYFAQRFAADPDAINGNLTLPALEVEKGLIIAVLQYIYTHTIDSSLITPALPYSAFWIDLFYLSLRFYLPNLTALCCTALDHEEIGIRDGDMESLRELLVRLYENKRGKKWHELRTAILQRQAWKLVKLPWNTLTGLQIESPSICEDIAEGFRRALDVEEKMPEERLGLIRRFSPREINEVTKEVKHGRSRSESCKRSSGQYFGLGEQKGKGKHVSFG